MSLALASRRAAISPAWVKNPLWRTARAVPSLDQPFADTKSLVDAVTGQSLVTFTRASSGTSVGSDGVLRTAAVNEPRFDHNPTTGESLGLLVEEQRTNLLLQSEDFSTTWSTSLCAVTVNTQSSPSGAQTADTLTDQNGSTGSPFAFQTVALADSTTYVMSCYLKAGTKTTARVGIRAKDGTVVVANFDLSAGTTTVGNATASSIQAVGNGWYRCVAICASSTGATSQRGLVYIDTVSYTANGTGTIHLWGAQLEAGAFPTSYIPTTTATATRSADVASVTGTAFSSWYRQDEGSFYVSFSHPALPVQAGARIFNASNSTATDQFWGRMAGGSSIALDVSASGISQAVFSAGSPSANETSRAAIAARANDFFASRNGTGYGPDVSGAMPSAVDRLGIGMEAVSNGSQLNGTIRRLVYWGQRLPNNVLQAITQ